jgi:hypothetical protein
MSQRNSSIQPAPIYKLQLLNNQFQSLLMLNNGNSIHQEFSANAENNSTTVSWLSVMMPQETGKLRTLGVPHGEFKDSSPSLQVTLAVFATLLHGHPSEILY